MTERPKYTRDVICFANSRKTSGRCIAGREVSDAGIGKWLRPVSSRGSGEVSLDERRFEDGREPRNFDVVRIPLLRVAPHNFQLENHVLDDRFYWRKIRRATDEEILSSIETVDGPLWNVGNSSYSGQNDRLAEAAVKADQGSLKLLSVDDLTFVVAIEGAEFGNGKRRVRGIFSLNGWQYTLSVTDNLAETAMLKKPDGEYPVGKAIICVSLGEPYNGYVYKLIAGVMKHP